MSKPLVIAKIITGNALLSGDAIYLTDDDKFSEKLSDAQMFTDIDSADRSLMKTKARVGEILDPYLIDIEIGEGGPVPMALREVFRSSGPTNYPHGFYTRTV